MNSEQLREGPQLEQALLRFMDERPKLRGAGLIVVDRDAGVVFEGFYGDLQAEQPVYMASVGKLLAAGMIMRLHDAGILDIDAPISRYGFESGSITLAQLMSNSSGLPCIVEQLNPAPFRCQYEQGASLSSCGEEIWEAHRNTPERRPPDQVFCYGGAQWQLAAAVAVRAAQKNWSQLYHESYRGACALSGEGFVNPFATLANASSDRLEYPQQEDLRMTDNPNIEAGLWVPAMDVAKILLMHLRQGKCEGESVISAASVARMQEDRIAQVYQGEIALGMPNFFLDAFGRGYGLSWWVHRKTGQRIVPGAFGSTAWMSADKKRAAIAVSRGGGIVGQELFVALAPLLESSHHSSSNN